MLDRFLGHGCERWTRPCPGGTIEIGERGASPAHLSICLSSLECGPCSLTSMAPFLSQEPPNFSFWKVGPFSWEQFTHQTRATLLRPRAVPELACKRWLLNLQNVCKPLPSLITGPKFAKRSQATAKPN